MVEKPLGKCITTKILNSTYVVKERNGFCYNDFLPSQAIVCFLLHNKVNEKKKELSIPHSSVHDLAAENSFHLTYR